ncbi:Uncharacterized protein TCM_023887 [Theobroma cacao]|uniref:Uncharacterized protein n=1 Tax=Theobroma cacao TaxID=3641 RepID=A0A061EVD8_THECC|nr:Uncharacterized protein TCM_023887 [Theobroma cacao]
MHRSWPFGLGCDVWEELLGIMGSKDALWCLSGDFNNIRYEHEKTSKGEIGRFVIAFKEFIDELALVDLPLTRAKFIWCGNCGRWVFSHLDRFLLKMD